MNYNHLITPNIQRKHRLFQEQKYSDTIGSILRFPKYKLSLFFETYQDFFSNPSLPLLEGQDGKSTI